MKKILVLLSLMFCGVARADSITLNWLDTDGTVSSTTSCTIGGDVILPTPPTKYGYTFQGWAANYIPLEYIESTGTQYIDTGIGGFDDGNWEIYIKWMLTGTPIGNYSAVCAVYANEQSNTYRIILHKDSTTMYLVNGNSVAVNTDTYFTNIAPNMIHEGTIRNGSVTLDGVTKTRETQGDAIPSSNTMRLFKSTYQSTFVGRIYATHATKNGVMQYNLIPVKLSSNQNVVGMYDTVSRQFLTNAGTGDFIAGPVLGGGE